jgi:hypothetical protein
LLKEDKMKEFSIIFSIVLVITAIIFYFAGWDIVYGGFWYSLDPCVINKNGIFIEINDKIFGIVRTERFFDSPVIQWLLLCFSFMFLIAAFFVVILPDNDNRN